MDEKRIKELEQRPFTKIFPKAINDIKNEVCPTCGKRVRNFRDYQSIKEYKVSGVCQDCQDRAFG